VLTVLQKAQNGFCFSDGKNHPSGPYRDFHAKITATHMNPFSWKKSVLDDAVNAIQNHAGVAQPGRAVA